MAEVRWTLQAADDFEAICLFIARDSEGVAIAFGKRLFDAIERLGSNPRLGRVVPESRNEATREMIVGSYRVIYRICEDCVEVLTIHHGARTLAADRLRN